MIPAKYEFNPLDFYLIQRLVEHRSEQEGRKGVDRHIGHDYMGSAEYEFGRIPDAWTALRVHALNQNLQLSPTKRRWPGNEDQPLWMIHQRQIQIPVLEHAIDLSAKREINHKENPRLYRLVEPTGMPPSDTLCGWLLLDRETNYNRFQLPAVSAVWFRTLSMAKDVLYELLAGEKTRQIFNDQDMLHLRGDWVFQTKSRAQTLRPYLNNSGE